MLLDIDEHARRAAAVDPSLVLEGPRPQWQVEPGIWNHVRRAVDAGGIPGQFILTGSSVPADDMARHTGAGRFSFFRMRPMTLYETGHTNGAVSLAALLAGEAPRSQDPGLSVSDLAARITAGGWPGQHDGGDGPLDRHTVTSYLDILDRLMVIEDQPAWAPHMRSRANLRTSPKRHFVDPSLAVAALGAGPERLLGDLEYLGLLYESLVVRDLRVLSQPLDGRVFHYRDNYGVEVDAVVQLADGRWAAFEAKLGPGLVDEGVDSLLRFRAAVDTRRSGEPAVLGVIVGTGLGYVRHDGIAVIPVGSLAP